MNLPTPDVEDWGLVIATVGIYGTLSVAIGFIVLGTVLSAIQHPREAMWIAVGAVVCAIVGAPFVYLIFEAVEP